MAGVSGRDERADFYAEARERFKLRLTLLGVNGCAPRDDTFVVNGCGCDGCECALPEVGGGEVAAPETRVAGVRFRDSGKTYYVDPGDLDLTPGQPVIVETSRGREIGAVVVAPHEVIASRL